MLNQRGVVGIALIVTLLVLLSGCATNGMTRAEREQAYDVFITNEKLESVSKITAFRFSGWNDLSDRHLILNVSVNRYYLVTLRSNCYGLDHSINIRVNNTGSILQAKFDSISVPSDYNLKCYIDSIHKISKEQRKALNSLHKQDDEETDADGKTVVKSEKTV